MQGEEKKIVKTFMFSWAGRHAYIDAEDRDESKAAFMEKCGFLPEDDSIVEVGTCKHCQRLIINSPEDCVPNGWVHSSTLRRECSDLYTPENAEPDYE